MDRPGPKARRVDLGREAWNRSGREAVLAAVATLPFLQLGSGLWWLFLVFWPLAYLLSCLVWVGRPCGRCQRAKVLDDGRGNMRPWNCNKCRNEGYRLRWGARLMGKTRADLQRKKY